MDAKRGLLTGLFTAIAPVVEARFEGSQQPSHGRGHRFDPCSAHHEFALLRQGFSRLALRWWAHETDLVHNWSTSESPLRPYRRQGGT